MLLRLEALTSSQCLRTYGARVAMSAKRTARWEINPHKRNGADPDDYEPADTFVLDEDAVMETSEFRKLVDLEPRPVRRNRAP